MMSGNQWYGNVPCYGNLRKRLQVKDSEMGCTCHLFNLQIWVTISEAVKLNEMVLLWLCV